MRGARPTTDSPDSLALSLEQLMRAASNESDPDKAVAVLLNDAVRATGASAGRLYKLDLSQSAYIRVFPNGEERIRVQELSKNTSSLVEQVIIFKKRITQQDVVPQVFRPFGYRSRTVIPLLRGPECLGVLDFEAPDPDRFTPEIQTFLCSVGLTCILLFEKQRTLSLLTAIQQPVDFHQPFRDFLNELLLLISSASGMPFIVLREYDPKLDLLECLAQFGFDESKPLADLNIQPVSANNRFQAAVRTGKSVIEPNKEADAQMSAWKEIEEVKSYVVTPVRVGQKTFGTLSFGASCRYGYTALEVAGFESIANSIGVSITNYRNFHNRQADIIEKIKTSTSITAADVAQTARHEAREHLGMAQETLLLMETYVTSPNRENVQKLKACVSRMGDIVQDIGFSLDKIRDITKPPEQTKRRCSLNQLWGDAFGIVQWRLVSEKIHYQVSDKAVEADVFPDYLLHAFLNLILNSIDAFREFGKKGNREISVEIAPPSPLANTIRMTYTDNASGIDASRLWSPESKDKYSVQDIFEVGVTSKKAKGGSGYGLYLVRNILQEHDGSIDLISHRQGVQFEIVIPKPKGRKKAD